MPEGGGREIKTKSAKSKRWQQGGADEPTTVSRSKSKKSGKRNKHRDDSSDDSHERNTSHPRSKAAMARAEARAAEGARSISDRVFVSWEHLLSSNQSLKMQLDRVIAVHGWERRSSRKSLLGGFEPQALLESIQAEIAAIDPAAEALQKADILLELQAKRNELGAVAEERDRLTDSLHQLREDCFEAQERLEVQSSELDELRAQAIERDIVEGRGRKGGSGNKTNGSAADEESEDSLAPSLAIFQTTLSRNQFSHGKAVIQALEKLKLPDESAMGPQELACWHENKKTIRNSLKTLSSQIYSAKTRILYEIIQNADDCSFDDGVIPELRFESSEDGLIAWHNERGFQPKDLYALCQVGESSKAAGSGKIGRKGIGFKSVFQICDCPTIVSAPFSFCFDTITHGAFGFIVPSWVEDPTELVPAQHRHLLECGEHGSAAGSGTMLICPVARRGHKAVDLLRDLQFEGLSLAFLKHLEKIRFGSTIGDQAQADSNVASREYRLERAAVFEHGGADQEDVGQSGGVLDGISVISHRLSQCTIIEQLEFGSGRTTETRRYYRLHDYTIHKYKTTEAAVHEDDAATTTISLAFPVDQNLAPLRAAEAEHVFAYLPVTVAGLGFAINADFELVASRQDVNDSTSVNHMILGRIPPLFVHAVLADPVLGETAFPVYLPDVEAVCRDRTASGRKWFVLASALHRQTDAWLIIPTEDPPERVRRRNVVLRPPHLSRELVPNSLLKKVSAGELHFAHPEAVTEMCLETCISVCPVHIVLDCLRAVIDAASEIWSAGEGAAHDKIEQAASRKSSRKSSKAKRIRAVASCLTLSQEVLRDIWRYISAEVTARTQQSGAPLDSFLKLIVSACIGDASEASVHRPFRIFPVQGSATLRLHCEHGVPLCRRISTSLVNQPQGAQVHRLAERCVPLLDFDRLADIECIEETMDFLQVGDATQNELDLQLHNCFRFGLAPTADAQLWWDSFQYAVSRGCPHGLVEFMSGAAVAIPLTDGRVVSSHDAHRLSLSLPCILGMKRKSITANRGKHVVAMPPSATSWGERVRWELALVQAFGVTYPETDIERLPAGAILSEVLYSIAQARDQRDINSLQAFGSLLKLYEQQMETLIPTLRTATAASSRFEDCLLEPRSNPSSPISCSCSPRYVEELMRFAGVTLSDPPLFHNTKSALEESLGVLQLQPVCDGDREKDVGSIGDQTDEGNLEEMSGDTTDEDTEDSGTDEEELDEETPPLDEADACDLATWEVLSSMLGFRHSFDPSHCPWILYSALTPTLLDGHQLTSTASRMKPFLQKISVSAVVDSGAEEIWGSVCEASGFWLNGNFVRLDQCVWSAGDTESFIWRALLATGGRNGPIVALEPILRDLLGDSAELKELKKRCVSGSSQLPHPTDLDMMLDNVLLWLLELNGVADTDPSLQNSHDSWSDDIQMCYSSVVNTISSGKLPPTKRWQLPVPSANLSICRIVIDASFNRLLNRDAEALVVLPDCVNWPVSTDLVISHFGSCCLHPELATIFSQIADRQSVSLESPRIRILRTLKTCLRLVANDDTSTNDVVWNLVGEVQSTAAESDWCPSRCSDNDKWDLLLWAAITCATQWHQMHTSGMAEDAASYQQTLSHTRRLVPFITEGTYADGDDERWTFILSSAESQSTPDPVLLLRTLFGFSLWGNLDGLELRGRPPTCTADIPSTVLFNCTARSPEGLSLFPEHFDRASLILVWEWFLLEVVGAAPPAVLWASFQEPIAGWARARIRAAEASLREAVTRSGRHVVGCGQSLEDSLLESVIAHTQIDILFDEMDAADEARRVAAAQEAEARQREREAAEIRSRHERQLRRTAEQSAREDRRSEQAVARQRQQAREQERQEETQRQHAPNNQTSHQTLSFFDAGHQALSQHSTRIRRMVADTGDSGVNIAPVQRHTQAPMMRESQVRGKLVRFLAGMRAYERQHAPSASPDQSLPPVLADFIAWSGNFLEARDSSRGGGSSDTRRCSNQTGIEAEACKYIRRDRANEAGTSTEDSEEACPICLEDVGDISVFDTLGEPVWTACGHCFHAVCFARHMESSTQDPWCPVCRGTDMTVRFSAGRRN